jgi:membrane-bound lytic murein transglycosylase B
MPFFPAALRPPLLLVSVALLLFTVSQPLSTSAAPRQNATEAREEQISFAAWLADFRREAQRAGISSATLNNALRGLRPDSQVIAADRSQPEFTRPIWEYLDGALSLRRLARAEQLLEEHAPLLHRIEQYYGVDRQTLVAIWGLESNFGQTQGSKSVVRSLATLAHEGRRPEFAHQQLIAALQILDQGDISPRRMRGSWAGAMGQTQFIPTTYQRYAVDFDGDGRRDIWNSTADALASTAHYLQRSGWRLGQPWGFEVGLPANFDYSLADPQASRTLLEWQQRGVSIPDLPPQYRDQEASLLLPAGHLGPAFLTLANFRAILKYNNSSAYGMAIGLFGDRLNGNGEISARWPYHQRPLSRIERIELQERLTRLGYTPGEPDGIIGAGSRQAIRAFQMDHGLAADGFASTSLLKRLRRETARR